MTEDRNPQGPGGHGERGIERLLRETLAGHDAPPGDMPDLEASLRSTLHRRRNSRWLPLAAAVGVLVVVAGVVTAIRWSGSAGNASPADRTSSVSSTQSRATGGKVTTGSSTTGPAPKFTLTAVPAGKPYRTAPASFATYGFGDPKAAPACTSATLSMTLVQMRTGTAYVDGGSSVATYFTVLGREIGAAACSLDQHGLPVQARDSNGTTVSQDVMSTADGRPSVRVDPGDVVVLQGNWDFFCGRASGPLTATVVQGYSSSGVAIRGWTLPGTIPVPGPIAQCANMAGGGPALSAISVGRPGSLSTLDAALSLPPSAASGASVGAVVTLTNRTTTAVPLAGCPDISVTTSDPNSDGSTEPTAAVMRLRCPAGLTLAAGESVGIELSLRAPTLSAPGVRRVSVDWYHSGDVYPQASAASGTYAITVNGVGPTQAPLPTTGPALTTAPTTGPAPTGYSAISSPVEISSVPDGSSNSPGK